MVGGCCNFIFYFYLSSVIRKSKQVADSIKNLLTLKWKLKILTEVVNPFVHTRITLAAALVTMKTGDNIQPYLIVQLFQVTKSNANWKRGV